MKTLNESNIRSIVSATLKRVLSENGGSTNVAKYLNENFSDEYRTKGSLNKKTSKKIADKQVKQAESDDYNPDWDESVDDILAKYDHGEEFDDTKAGGDYKIDKRNPYFFTKDGKRVDADAIGDFHNDYAIVKLNGRVNYITNDGVLLCDDWFDACNDFEGGFGLVSKDKKRNFVCSNGELLLSEWVDRAGDFIGGAAPVIINGERFEVDSSGNIC